METMTEHLRRHMAARLRETLACALMLVATPVGPVSAAPPPELLDRVLAVVSGTIITLSDARAAIELGFVDVQHARDPVATALTWLIERQLILAEATRFDVPEDDAASVEAAVNAVRRRFPSDDEWDRAKLRLGLTDDGIRVLTSENLHVRQYVEQRFTVTAPASDQDLQRYYAAHRAEFVRGGQPLSFDEARADVEARVSAERRTLSIADWVARLRRRAEVSEIYTPIR
jgi:hypothetical protein